MLDHDVQPSGLTRRSVLGGMGDLRAGANVVAGIGATDG
jgi:hypothetical protein